MKLMIVLLLFVATAAAAQDLFRAPVPREQQDSVYGGVYLDIDRVMESEKLTRFEAIETQRRMKDIMAASASTTKDVAYAQALVEVRAGNYASGWNPKLTLTSKSDVIVALDLDETLLAQWYKSGEDCNDLSGLVSDLAKTKWGNRPSSSFVKFTPGVEPFLRKLKATPHVKGVVFFSAKGEPAMAELLAKWRFTDGTFVKSFVHGVFTRNHLVINDQTSVPSKDLRVFDPALQNVLLIDDNPSRVLQPQVLYVEPEFLADDYCKALKVGNTAVLNHYNGLLDAALSELNKTVALSEKLDIPFGRAFFKLRALRSSHSQ